MNFDKLDSTIDSFLEDYIRKPVFIKGLLHLVLALYVVRLAPQLPLPVLRLFENAYFKLFIFSIVLWSAQFSPSTALLISLAFLVTMNYVNTGKVWEFLENVPAPEPVQVSVPKVDNTPPPPISTPATAIEAVKVLADAAVSPSATAPAVVDKITEVAIGSVSTPEGAVAVKALSDQAKITEPGEPTKVLQAAQTAVDSIAPAKTVSDKIAVEAVKALAEAAVTPTAQKAADVIPVATLAIEAAKNDNEAVKAVKELAAAALDASAANPQLVTEAAKTAIVGITAPESPAPAVAAPAVVAPAPAPAPAAPEAAPAAGCYPVRKYDISKVQPYMLNQNEDYQIFTSTPQ